jgi:methanogenic corrinoid protein MtbC1
MFSFSLSLSPTLAQQSFVQTILAQVDRDTTVLKILHKLNEVYSLIAQKEMRGEISSMHAILGKISQQTRECARFIKNYSQTKKSCES